MATRSRDIFTTIHSEGALLPADLLQRIVDSNSDLDGLRAEDYHLPGQRLNEAISQTWNRLQGAWASFKAAREKLPEGDLGTSVTRERWLLPLFDALSYGRLETARAVEIDGKSYPISHRWRNVPIHLLGCNVDLDARTRGVAGAASATPHGLLQVYLNRSDDTLWGFLSNGLRLRILRDNASLTRQAFVDFDLEAMMEGEVYADFVLLVLLCHQSRVEADKPGDFWLETWMKAAQQQGTRALDQLRDGVQEAIERLGAGFIDHPTNHPLREALQTGTLDTQDYYRQLLRLVYRLLFLFTAEDRGLLHPDGIDEDTRQRYHDYYSARRLREMAGRIKGTRHHDLFEGLRLVTRLLSGEAPYADAHRAALGLPALNGWLFREEAVGDIIDCRIANRDLLDGVRALAYTEDRAACLLRPVDYKNLGPEELGSVYESLLELHPQIHIDARSFTLGSAAGHERKTTGSYYTPDSLVQALLDSALDPVIDQARRAAGPEAALLALKVCDPACGSGHFLIAAARRIARVLASVRTGEEEPPPAALRHAVRDVIGRCIYGVDINPMAVELCKVNLWMEALEPGKPLSFLDHRILCGNSLLGTTPALIAQGIPDDAFNPIEGDDPKFASGLKKQNREERKGQMTLFAMLEPRAETTALATELRQIADIPDDSLDGVRAKEETYHQLAISPEYVQARLLADAWCAAFVWEKVADTALPLTDLVFRRLANKEQAVIERVGAEVARLANQYQFFHWHVAFPDVFDVSERVEDAENTQTGWNGGFDCVLGNPPWERLRLLDQEWFAQRLPEIALQTRAAHRRQLIADLVNTAPEIYQSFLAEKRRTESESWFSRFSGRYPLAGRGDVNTYQLFAELGRSLIASTGYLGIIVPSGIATDTTNQYFFQALIETGQLARLYDFENRERLFATVHGQFRFCLLTICGVGISFPEAEFAFYLFSTRDLSEPTKVFRLSADDIALINPTTRTAPIFRTSHDANLTKDVYRRLPILAIDSGDGRVGWPIELNRMFHMTDDAALFKTRAELEQKGGQVSEEKTFVLDDVYLRMFEGRLGYQFNHRYATQPYGELRDVELEELRNPYFFNESQYFVSQSDFAEEIQKRVFACTTGMLVYRRISNSTNERTAIACIIPWLPSSYGWTITFGPSAEQLTVLCATYNSFIFDYLLRNSVSQASIPTNSFMQVAAPPPELFTPFLLGFISARSVELIYTAWDMQPFAQDIGYDGPPFIWDADRRFLMRCELDALYFHLYQIAREDVDYVMETFPIVKRKDEAAYGEYRTKRIILQLYDQMATLPKVSVPHPKGIDEAYLVPDVSQWQTWLTPPPADRSVAHKAI